jgi:hypothetical protein
MDNFDLKKFLIENKLTRNSILSELDYDMSNNSYFGTPTTTFDKFKKERSIKWTKDALEQEADKYNSATEFNQNNRSAYQSYINAVNKGLIQNKFKRSGSGFGNKWTKDALEQEADKYNSATEFKQNNNSAYVTYINAVNRGLIQNKFKGVEKKGRSIKWTKDALEQEADKYNTVGEFRQADINTYTTYMAAVRKDIIQNKFERSGFGNKWTKDALEQEASKYNTPTEFQKTNSSAYQAYLLAVKKGLIPDRFEDNRINTKWTPEKLEQEAAKYNTQNDFFKTDLAAFVAYKRAVKKGLIQDKFKKDKPTINENKMQDFDLKRFLVENKMTRNSRLLNEITNGQIIQFVQSVDPEGRQYIETYFGNPGSFTIDGAIDYLTSHSSLFDNNPDPDDQDGGLSGFTQNDLIQYAQDAGWGRGEIDYMLDLSPIKYLERG